MTRRGVAFFAAWIAVTSLSLWAAFTDPFSQRLEGTPAASLFRSSGTVQYRPNEISVWDYASTGQTFVAHDVVATGDRSMAALTVPDGRIVQLEANTQLEIDFSKEDQDTVVRVLKGKVQLTPGATRSTSPARGVSFVVDGKVVRTSHADTILHLSRDVRTGEVAIAAENGEATVVSNDPGSAALTTLLGDGRPAMKWRPEVQENAVLKENPPQIDEEPSFAGTLQKEPSTDSVLPVVSIADAELPARRNPEPLLVRISSSARALTDLGNRLSPLMSGSLQDDTAVVISGNSFGLAASRYRADIRQGAALVESDLSSARLTEVAFSAKLDGFGSPFIGYQTITTAAADSEIGTASYRSSRLTLGWLFTWQPDHFGVNLGIGPLAIRESVKSTIPGRAATGDALEQSYESQNETAFGATLRAGWISRWGQSAFHSTFVDSFAKLDGRKTRTKEVEWEYSAPPWAVKNLRFAVLGFAKYVEAKNTRPPTETEGLLDKVDIKQTFGGLGISLKW